MKQFLARQKRYRLSTVILTMIMLLGSSAAQSQAQDASDKPNRSVYDNVWKHAQLFHNEQNSVIQNLAFTGRFQGDYALLSADQGSHDEWNIRRFRVGARATLFRNITVHGEVDLDPQGANPVYLRMTDMYVQWNHPGASFALTFGKQSAPFTMDGATSSKELLTIDRNNLSNNMWFPQEYLPGVSVSGRVTQWLYRVGVYSAGAANREFGRFNGSVLTLVVLGYDFANSLGLKEALLTGNYIYQNPDEQNTFTRQLHHIASVSFRFDTGKWGARTDVSAASGYLGQSDLWGLTAMPFVNATDKLQFVGRYTFLNSRDPNGIRLARYESTVVAGRGNRYNELYLGANYYFYGHKLKFQTGVQLADMNDRANDGGTYSGVSWTSAIRVGW